MASRRILTVDELGKNVAFTLQDSLEKPPNCEIAAVTGGEQTLQ
jgi:hypothetical protein